MPQIYTGPFGLHFSNLSSPHGDVITVLKINESLYSLWPLVCFLCKGNIKPSYGCATGPCSWKDNVISWKPWLLWAGHFEAWWVSLMSSAMEERKAFFHHYTFKWCTHTSHNHSHKHSHTHTHTHTLSHIHMHTITHTYIYIYIYIYIHARWNTYTVHSLIHTHTHTSLHQPIYTAHLFVFRICLLHTQRSYATHKLGFFYLTICPPHKHTLVNTLKHGHVCMFFLIYIMRASVF